ncbi:uncharacterized protein LOC18444353 [Amborella trichopoda]|uniref:FYVE-type domain-containing protein n=1 Tax=Amborella trichopoda TaxID=13333 RepID=U5D1G7_AMBTC|nr:uncharacterized protein LOC18444353 [Amborella trichopoda]ERN16055.1 hypothetical protein AMTR_s00030p00120950 [Amborella trichopoda]|eukprot:XP_006854588.1 uncharacterized protein LOC18444353 [Amborella trichopoda]
MADPAGYGGAERNIEQAIVALKKGAQLLKYGRKGKPKFCPFRISNDESTLIWYSRGEERKLKLASVTKIIPGQRTVIFKRYLCPEKDYLSFSLLYNNGERSLDLICKDKVEAEVWFGGLKALISGGQHSRSKIDGRSEGGLYFSDGVDFTPSSPSDSSFGAALEISSPEASISLNTKTLTRICSLESLLHHERSVVGSENPNMQVKGATLDTFRVSVSSAPSSSSQGSAHDDCDALGDVYIWGDVLSDTPVKPSSDGAFYPLCSRTDVLLPKPLESNAVLDVHHVSCGFRHAAIVTRQGEVFTWGEESGGRLGHGVGTDVSQPRLVESLATCNVDFVACGEYHTCAVTMTGDLYTWGDGTHNLGLLGHGTDVSHWIPKRVAGPLEGVQVASVSCGPWHTALVTSTGRLFTFGDGTFGILGHGNRESVAYPREVESLKGLRTIAVACGVWHTAAIVEVIVAQSSASLSSGKLFTWGDGDKNRLGHGDKETRLVPTCVPSIIEYNFHKLACGHSLTVGLTTSGHVFSMGSTVYGQLGNPQSDGKLPCLVEDKLAGETVEEIDCGSYHVAVLTSRSEVYTWGKGANGRLGHGDVEDRKTPTLVEALKDRHVKMVSCGSNFTAVICIHKWVSGSDQSQCSACRQTFGFTRKRHNCYNCGLVHCHSCSSRKALRAALSPNPGKPYRVCDSCYAKLNKVSEASAFSSSNKKNIIPRRSSENKDKLDKSELKSAKIPLPINGDLIKILDTKLTKQGKKSDSLSIIQTSQIPNLFKDISFPIAIDQRQAVRRPVITSAVHTSVNSRAASPFSRRPSPPRSATPMPTTGGLSFSKSIADSLKKTNELLNQEVQKLQSQVENLRRRCELQEMELQQSAKKAQEAAALAAEEAAKCKAAKEVIKSLTAQLKDMAERLPPGVYDTYNNRPVYLPNGIEPDASKHSELHEESLLASHGSLASTLPFPTGVDSGTTNGFSSQNHPFSDAHGASETTYHIVNHRLQHQNLDLRSQNGNDAKISTSSRSTDADAKEQDPHEKGEYGSKLRNPSSMGSDQVEEERIEQYEPGVYITLVLLRDGTRDLKRVRFSRRRFGEAQAATWWSENREKVFERYRVKGCGQGPADNVR